MNISIYVCIYVCIYTYIISYRLIDYYNAQQQQLSFLSYLLLVLYLIFYLSCTYLVSLSCTETSTNIITVRNGKMRQNHMKMYKKKMWEAVKIVRES